MSGSGSICRREDCHVDLLLDASRNCCVDRMDGASGKNILARDGWRTAVKKDKLEGDAEVAAARRTFPLW
jgi:hypothetical protein